MTLDVDVANLVHTYTALVESVPGSEVRYFPSGILATGPIKHPICNFALIWEMDDDLLKQVRNLPLGSYFHLYLITESQYVGEISGFKSSYELTLMAKYPGISGQGRSIQEANTEEQRIEIATFMAHQFFGKAAEHSVRLIAHSTAEATKLELYGFKLGLVPRLYGAAMLSRPENSIGLYNLCVEPLSQGKGLGTEIVHDVLRIGFETQLPVVLQCDRFLVPWYEKHGFVEVGFLKTWILT